MIWKGEKDHIHCLFKAKPTTALAKFINTYKSAHMWWNTYRTQRQGCECVCKLIFRRDGIARIKACGACSGG